MTLSKANEPFETRIYLYDLFNRTTTQIMWQVLAQAGYYLKPEIVTQFLKQRTCFFCGEPIITYKIDETNWEERCVKCGYVYKEK